MRKLLVVFAIALLGGFLGSRISAQSTTLNLTVASGTTSANCQPGVAAQTSFCLTGGGSIYSSVNGAAYVCIAGPACPATSAGVTSWNGLTGVVTYTAPVAPVTSVNGKTGAVVIGATATAPTVTLQ
jgi:hypothetical protein